MNESSECSQESTKTARMPFHWRGFFSLLLFASFSILLVSGVILYIAPRGRIANWTGWAILRLSKHEWSAVHISLAVLVLIAAGFHLYYNWSVFWSYITCKTQRMLNLKREMALALLLCVITIFGAIYGLPPFGTFMKWNDRIKDYWEKTRVTAPTPHAEEFSIEQLTEEVDMPLDQLIERLEDAGIAVDDPSVKVKDLAAAHGMTPSELFAIIQPTSARSGRGAGGMGRGMGRGGGGGGRGRGAGMD